MVHHYNGKNDQNKRGKKKINNYKYDVANEIG